MRKARMMARTSSSTQEDGDNEEDKDQGRGHKDEDECTARMMITTTTQEVTNQIGNGILPSRDLALGIYILLLVSSILLSSWPILLGVLLSGSYVLPSPNGRENNQQLLSGNIENKHHGNTDCGGGGLHELQHTNRTMAMVIMSARQWYHLRRAQARTWAVIAGKEGNDNNNNQV